MLRAVSKKSLAPSLGRAFHTSNVRYTNSFFTGAGRDTYYLKKPLEELAKKPFEPGLLNQWGGVAPFIGALGAIAVTKEILLLDAEMLLAVSMTGVYIAIYLAIGDSVHNVVKGRFDNAVSWFSDAHDAAIAGCGFYKAEQKAKLDAEQCWKQYLDEYKDVMKAHAEAMAIKPRHVAREKVVASLEAIRAREKLQISGQWKKFIVAYEAAVRQVLADPDLQDDLFEDALFLIGEEDQQLGVDFQVKLNGVLETALAIMDPELADGNYPGALVEDDPNLIEEEDTPEAEAESKEEFDALDAQLVDLESKIAAFEAAPDDDEDTAVALFSALSERDRERLALELDDDDSDDDEEDDEDEDDEEDDEDEDGEEEDEDEEDEEEGEVAGAEQSNKPADH